MTDTAITNYDIRNFKLTQTEMKALMGMLHTSDPFAERAILDVLVLSGMLECIEKPTDETTNDGRYMLTDRGTVVGNRLAVMDPNDRKNLCWSDNHEPITVGSLVRHTASGAIGIVTEHTMWDGDWGAFRVHLGAPEIIGGAEVSAFVDRADRWEKVVSVQYQVA